MYTWSPFPFLRIATSFILGILVYEYFQPSISLETIIILIGILFFTYLLLYLLSKKQNFILGNIGLILILILGYINAYMYDELNNKNHLIHFEEKISGYCAYTNSSVIEKEKNFIYNIIINEIATQDTTLHKTGIVKLYIKRTKKDTAPLKYGDKIQVNGNPFKILPPDNPNEFNYMKYMARQNIYFQQFVYIKDIKIISNTPNNIFMAWANSWRIYFSNKIDYYILSDNETAIAKALILGVKDGLDNKIKKSYATAGAMHILAVSGLHAGIIFMILQYIFNYFIKYKPWNIILPIFSIICLWAFAMITGLSPSIMRAVTMFTIIILGQYFFSRPNIFNSLSLSAFILLIYNPNFIFAVGFQLSYIAVAGIVYLFPLIYGMFSTRYWLLDKIWAISCVSIAAQIATFPLTIYYFHQFPTYFLVSNLVVIPIAFIIMSLGLLLLIFAEFFFLSDLIGFILEIFIKILNTSVFYIQEMKMSLIEWLYIDWIQMIAIYGIILFVLMLIYYRKMVFIKLILCCVLVISTISIYSIYQQNHTEKLIFYKIKGQSIIDNIAGLKSNIISVNPINNLEVIKHQIELSRLSNNLDPITRVDNSSLYTSKQFEGFKIMVWNKKKILFITQKPDNIKIKIPIQCDILIISNNSLKNIAQIKSIAIFKELIIDNTNNYYTRNSLLKESKIAGIKYTSITKNGAIIIEKLAN